jgi:hypothetical protein
MFKGRQFDRAISALDAAAWAQSHRLARLNGVTALGLLESCPRAGIALPDAEPAPWAVGP